MANITMINRPSDYPGTPDESTAADLAALFGQLFPGNPEPAFDKFHAGLAIAAHSPKLALQLAQTSALIAGQLGWCQRKDLRELAIQAVNLHFKSDYSFASRLPAASACGVSEDQLAALPDWRASQLFDSEQRLAIEFAHAVASGDVPAALFARVTARWGERGAVECTALIAFWAFWAMFINAAGATLE